MTSPHATSIWFLTCLLAKGPWTYAGPTLCSPNIHINSNVVLNMRNAAIPNCLLRFTSKSLKLLWGGLTSFYNVEENAISHEIRNDTFQEVDSSNDSDQKIFKSEICAKYRPAYQASLRVSLAFIWVKVWVRNTLPGLKYGLPTPPKKLTLKLGIIDQKIALSACWWYPSEYGLATSTSEEIDIDMTTLYWLFGHILMTHRNWLLMFLRGRFSTKRSKRAAKEVTTNTLKIYFQWKYSRDFFRFFKSISTPIVPYYSVFITWLLFKKRGERFLLPTLNGPTHLRENTWVSFRSGADFFVRPQDHGFFFTPGIRRSSLPGVFPCSPFQRQCWTRN